MKTVEVNTMTQAFDALWRVLNQGKRRNALTQLSLLSYGTYYVGSLVTMYDIDSSFSKDFDELVTGSYEKVTDETTLHSAYQQLLVFCRRIRRRLDDLS